MSSFGRILNVRTAILCVLVLIAGFIIWRVVVGVSVSNQLASIHTSRLPTSGSGINNWLPTVAEPENGALELGQALAQLKSFPDARSNEVRKSDLVRPGTQWTEETHAMVAEIVAMNSAALTKAREAVKFQKFRFPIDYSFGPETQLPHLTKLKDLARIASLESALALENGAPEKALDSIELILKLGATLDREPISISLLVRDSIFNMACGVTQRALNRAELSAGACERLQNAFAGILGSNTLPFVLAGERAINVPLFRMSFEEIQRFDKQLGEEDSAVLKLEPHHYEGRGFMPFWISGFFERDLNFYLRAMQTNIAIAALPTPQNFPRAKDAEEAKFKTINGRHYVYSGLLLPAFEGLVKKENAIRATVALTQTALAVERFRRLNGKLPLESGELTPLFLKEILNDPFDGKPIRYKRIPAGYVLYSVDADGEDNNGLEAPAKKKLDDKTKYDLTFKVER